MALDYRVIGFGFGPVTGHEQILVGAVDFGQPVARAETTLQGFISRFDGGDHHMHRHDIVTSVERIEGSKVYVKVRYLLRDHSGNIDDPYSGAVHVLVLAQVGVLRVKAVMVKARRSTIHRKMKSKR